MRSSQLRTVLPGFYCRSVVVTMSARNARTYASERYSGPDDMSVRSLAGHGRAGAQATGVKISNGTVIVAVHSELLTAC